jgi:hypothetical protein
MINKIDMKYLSINKIMKINNIKLILISLFICSTSLFSQQNTENKTPATQPPLELPTFIIEGVEQINIKAGSKQFPSPPTLLTKNELDSLNPLEKQQSLLVPPPSLPKTLFIPKFPDGFLDFHYGLFSSIGIAAGYGTKWEGYDLYTKAVYDRSSGDVVNSDFNKLMLKLHSDYIAPDIFWIFGGSRTRSKTELNYYDYKLYGTDSAYRRKTYDIDFSLNSEGNYEGVNFLVGAAFYTLQLDQQGIKAFENRLEGSLKLNTLVDNYSLGLIADLNMGNLSGKDLSFYQFKGTGALYYDKMTLEGELGYQISSNTIGDNLSALSLKAVLSYLPNMNFSVRTEFISGLEKEFFKDYFRKNPYLAISTGYVYPKASAIIRGIVQYLPDTKKGATLTVGLNFYEKYPYFNSDTLNNVTMLFETANIINFKFEGFWELTEQNKINGFVGVNIGVLDYKSNTVPYLPLIETKLNYLRQWTDNLNSEVGFLYNSNRFADKDNKSEINSYLNLFVKSNYKILENLKIYLELDNLTNNNNILWQGYRERGLFGSFGLNWLF